MALLLLDDRRGQLPVVDMARSFIYWWPLIVAQAEAGTTWTVPHKVPALAFGVIRLVTP